MKELILEDDISLPKIEYDSKTKVLSIYGRIFPETPLDFKNPIFDWMNNSNKKISKLDLTLEFINTSSLMVLIEIIKEIKCKDIIWKIEKDDESMEDIGIMLNDFLDSEIKIIKINKINSINYDKVQKRNKKKYLNFFKKINKDNDL
jgi:anti-anti-sigma regulatory factor